MRRGAVGFLLALAAAPALAQPLHTPAAGSAERKALLDLLRPRVEAALGRPVIFVVSELRSAEGWAFAVVEPANPDGSPIREQAARLHDPDVELDGLRTEAVWRRAGGAWRLVDHRIGATDVWYQPYCGKLPKGVIAVCPD